MDDLQQMRLTSSSCAKVFIQRDYSEGVGVKFDNKLPPELQGKIDSIEFEEVIDKINSIYADAESLSAKTYLENCLACLTAYLILICMPTSYEKVCLIPRSQHLNEYCIIFLFKLECKESI